MKEFFKELLTKLKSVISSGAELPRLGAILRVEKPAFRFGERKQTFPEETANREVYFLRGSAVPAAELPRSWLSESMLKGPMY